MKRLSVAILVSCFSVSAMAKGSTSAWVPFNSNAYMLSPTSELHVLLMANIDSNSHNLAINVMDIDKDVTHCVINGENQTEDLGEISPFKLNGTYVRMRAACFNGTEIDQPMTQAGKDYLLRLVESGKPVELEITPLTKLEYKAANFESVKQGLASASRAL